MQISKMCGFFLCSMMLVLSAVVGATDDVAYTGGSNPEHAKPGEVWCLVTTAPQYKTVTERYECKPASCRFEVIPAVYEMQSEQVCVRKESKRCIAIPAVYRTETYNVEKCPARTEWQKVDCDATNVTASADESKGRCVALVAIPATFETRSRQICVSPASTRSEVIAAEFKNVEKRVRTCEESKRRIDVPAEFATRTKEVCTDNGKKVWRLSSCPAPIGVPNCNKCEEKTKCSPCEKNRSASAEVSYDSTR
jgi:hypothetical protein